MEFFTNLTQQVNELRVLVGDVSAADLAARVGGLDDDSVVAVITQTSALVRAAENLRTVAAGVAGARSTREHGHGGLVQ